MKPRDRTQHGFTLVELLIVISIIGVLIGITLPVFASVREKARSTVCRSNLRSIGLGLQVYMNENGGILPYALPLDDSEITGQQGEPQPDSILAQVGPTVDNLEVFICPSDDQIPQSLYDRPEGPVGAHCSYEYWAGWLMVFRELQQQDPHPERSVTRFYEWDNAFPVMADSTERHPGGPVYDQNAVYFGDWRSDWMILNPTDSEEEDS